MLTAKQASTYGYTSVHDLPTPPSSRHSPPVTYKDNPYKRVKLARYSHSPPPQQPMSGPHRGLPPPAAMTLTPHQQQGPPGGSHAQTHVSPVHHHHQHAVQQQPHPHHQPPTVPPGGQIHSNAVNAIQGVTTLPTPPSQWQGSEESMRQWLQARTEEERTKQEEERTRQETLRLEQRKIESEMLRASLGGGVPPPMVPLVFASMGAGGLLPQAALEWAQQFMNAAPGQQLQILATQGQASPQHQRDPSGQHVAQYASANPAQGPPHSAGTYQSQPGSPSRVRVQTIGGPSVAQSQTTMNPSHVGTNMAGGGLVSGAPTNPPHAQFQSQQSPQESGPGLYFHHWQPPTSQASGSTSAATNRPGSPPGEAPKKRKTGSSTDQPLRSPPQFSSSQPHSTATRRGHKRQRSDLSWYRPNTTQERAEESDRSVKEKSPVHVSRERSRSEVGKHSVSSLLSGEPTEQASDLRAHPWQSPSTYSGEGGTERNTRPGTPLGPDSRLQGPDPKRGKR